MNSDHSLTDWIAYVFDHPVTDPAWHWSPDAPIWDDSSERNATFIADAFERSGELLARFTDEQLNQGFWSVWSTTFARRCAMRVITAPSNRTARHSDEPPGAETIGRRLQHRYGSATEFHEALNFKAREWKPFSRIAFRPSS